jgi:hypothetical protein
MKVQIGSKYCPKFFERRFSDGRYQWLNYKTHKDERLLQTALLTPFTRAKSEARYLFACFVIVLCAVAVVWS